MPERYHTSYVRVLAVVLMAVSLPVSCTSWGNFWNVGGSSSSAFNLPTPLPAGSVAITNVRNGMVLETATLRGTLNASTGATAVEVSVDSGAYATATVVGTSWTYLMPIAKPSFSLNTSHTVLVRGKSAAGGVSPSVSANFRWGVNHDVNGDGYADLIVGADIYTTSTGRAYLFHGSAAGIVQTGANSANTIITGENISDLLGNNVALCDVNADGFSDMIIGAHQFSTDTGRIYIFYGKTSGITSGNANTATGATGSQITGAATNHAFSYSATCGDFNGDGIFDLAVGAQLSTTNTGRVHIFHGSLSGIATMGAAAANQTILGGATNNNFGSNVAAADIDGDGYSELIAGSRLYNTSVGRAYVFAGTSAGILPASTAGAVTTVTGESGNNEFGFAIAIGNANSDSAMDLVVGAPNWNNNGQGRAYYFPGGGTIGTGTANAIAMSIIDGATAATNDYYWPWKIIDMNGDGFGDLIGGGNMYNTNLGRAYVINSTGSAIPPNNTPVAETILTGEAGTTKFGYSMTASDFNGDGFPDLVVSAAAFGTLQGKVYIYYGKSGGIPSGAAATADRTILGGAANDQFGASVY